MALTRKERFQLLSQVLEEVETSKQEWDWPRQNLLLKNFGLPTMDGYQDSPTLGELLTEADDSTLLEVAQVVLGLSASETEDVAEVDRYDGNWKSGYVRMFISHSAVHKAFVSQVSDELATVGIHGFVAHEAMEVSAPWQAQIEDALRSMDVFVAMVHPEFGESAWCQQEVGWALGRRVPHFEIRMGADPRGFAGAQQWPSLAADSATRVSGELASWVARLDGFGDKLVDGSIASLAAASNYFEAEAAAKSVAKLGVLAEWQWQELNRAYWSNNQVHRGVLPNRVLEPFYKSQDRPWPPAKSSVR